MKSPPVIPIGLEYLAIALENHKHEVELLDLTFSDIPNNEIEKKLRENSYDIVGFTIRNIDSAIYFNNEFFLPKIKELVKIVKKHKIPIILGGAGFSAMPQEILTYLNADYGIIGPGVTMFPKFLDILESEQILPQIFDGGKDGIDSKLIYYRGKNLDYSRYLSEEGIVGFETHVGCPNSCPYCVEANTPVHYKNIQNIVAELECLSNQGYNHFHTCDTEFNTNLKFSINFCKALVEKDLKIKWALYMKPTPYNEELFKILKKAKAYLITLTVDSDERIQALNNYNYDDLARIINYCKKYDLELAIDLLTGYPGESLESTQKVLQFFSTHRPKMVGISFYYRIYENTALAALIKENSPLQNKLSRPFSPPEDFLSPIFYNQLDQKALEKLIEEDDIFKIAGLKPGVNYQF